MMQEVAYRIKTDTFEGPFDILLKAIDDGQIDIFRVSISQITASYFDYWRSEGPDLVLASDFLYMAAYLVEMKSRGLLPQPEEAVQQEIFIVEESLIKNIQDFGIYKTAARDLRERKDVFGRIYYGRHEGEKAVGDIELVNVSLRDLVLAFQKVYREAAEKEDFLMIPAEEIKIEDRIAEIKKMVLEREGGLPFEAMFLRKTKIEVVVTFLAVLELAKQRVIRITQGGRFGSIMIFSREAMDGTVNN